MYRSTRASGVLRSTEIGSTELFLGGGCYGPLTLHGYDDSFSPSQPNYSLLDLGPKSGHPRIVIPTLGYAVPCNSNEVPGGPLSSGFLRLCLDMKLAHSL